MGKLTSTDGVSGKAEIPILYSLIFLYSLLFFGCMYQLLKSLVYPTSQAILRQRLFYIVILFVSSCKYQIVRIIWASLCIFIGAQYQVIDLLGSISSLLMMLLGSTFALLWFEMYFTSNIILSQTYKIGYFSIVAIAYIILNSAGIIFGVLLIYDPNGKWKIVPETWKIFLILYCTETFFISLSLFTSGLLLSRNIRNIFYGNSGACISNRIWYVSMVSCAIFSIKLLVYLLSAAYLVLEYTGYIVEYFIFSSIAVVLYFLCSEIVPLTYILYILRTSSSSYAESDVLPSALQSFISESCHKSEAVLNLGQRLFSIFENTSSVSMVKMVSSSAVMENHIEEDFIINRTREITK